MKFKLIFRRKRNFMKFSFGKYFKGAFGDEKLLALMIFITQFIFEDNTHFKLCSKLTSDVTKSYIIT